jgi:hypothetical protein
MKDIDEIRRENILLIEQRMGSATIVANAAKMELAQYLNLRDGAKDSKTGKPRGMRKETAWRFDDVIGEHRGWLDIDHTAKTSDERILSIYNQLTPARQAAAEQSLLGLLALENAERNK